MNLTMSVRAVCDIGCKKPNNEDMILLQDEIFRDGARQASLEIKGRIVLAVADGIGGLDKGEEASELVLARLRDRLSKIPDDLTQDELHEVFNVYCSETHNAMPKGMGSTLAGLFVYKDKVYRYHAGDSRIYRLRRGELTRLTVDHSLRESGRQPNAPSNVITNSLGGGGSAFIEFAEIEHPFFLNDIYLLSSDGMHDLVEQKEIPAALKLPKSAEELVNLAKTRGGRDNISVITITIKE
jgi:serine/threonine protein phosphatase PrpC